MEFRFLCRVCSQPKTAHLPYTESEFARRVALWKAGELAQRAFPELTAGQREAIMTGTCDPCWDQMFAEDSHAE
jgi:hypothetical protein